MIFLSYRPFNKLGKKKFANRDLKQNSPSLTKNNQGGKTVAQLEFALVDDMSQGTILGERFTFPAQPQNKDWVIQLLRGFKTASAKQGVFSQEQIALAMPDYEGKTRQGGDDHERRFRERGGHLFHPAGGKLMRPW